MTIESKTKVSPVNPNSKSFRTSIPKEVMKALNLDKGDEMNWVIEAVDNNLKVRVEKSE